MAGKQQLFAREIWKQIEQGEFANGAYLPSERELARKYQLGRITVRLGLKLLLEKHLIETDSTRGYRVIRIPGMPDQSTLNIALFDLSFRDRLFHGNDNHVSDGSIPATGATDDLDTLNFPGSGVISHIKIAFYLNHSMEQLRILFHQLLWLYRKNHVLKFASVFHPT